MSNFHPFEVVCRSETQLQVGERSSAIGRCVTWTDGSRGCLQIRYRATLPSYKANQDRVPTEL